jgi:hypothetical protein
MLNFVYAVLVEVCWDRNVYNAPGEIPGKISDIFKIYDKIYAVDANLEGA